MPTIYKQRGTLTETVQASSVHEHFSDEELKIIVEKVFYNPEKKTYVKRAQEELIGNDHEEGILNKLGYTRFQARCIISDLEWHVPNANISVLHGKKFFDYSPPPEIKYDA